jgi:hypothetical protein
MALSSHQWFHLGEYERKENPELIKSTTISNKSSASVNNDRNVSLTNDPTTLFFAVRWPRKGQKIADCKMENHEYLEI